MATIKRQRPELFPQYATSSASAIPTDPPTGFFQCMGECKLEKRDYGEEI